MCSLAAELRESLDRVAARRRSRAPVETSLRAPAEDS
jgi:hypothetical protein